MRSEDPLSDFPLMPMGVLAHRLRTLDRSLVSPSEVISEVLEPLDNFSKYPPFLPKNCIVWGVGESPIFCCWLESKYFCYLGAHAKLQNPTTTPSGRISNEPEERERRKKCHL